MPDRLCRPCEAEVLKIAASFRLGGEFRWECNCGCAQIQAPGTGGAWADFPDGYRYYFEPEAPK